MKVDVEQRVAEGDSTRIGRGEGAQAPGWYDSSLETNKQKRQVNVSHDPNMVTSLQHVSWMDADWDRIQERDSDRIQEILFWESILLIENSLILWQRGRH